MKLNAFIILIIPLIGLSAICKGAKWNWKVIGKNKSLNVMFWFGWFTSLLVGLITLAEDILK